MKVLVDMDGVLNYLHKMVMGQLSAKGFIPLPESEWKTWDMSLWIEGTKDNEERRTEVLRKIKWIMESEDTFYFSMIRDEAEKIFPRICLDYDVYVVTSVWFDSKYCMNEKVRWLKYHFPLFDYRNKLICAWDKSMINGDVLIDDRSDNIRDFIMYDPTVSKKRRAIVFDNIYNRDCVLWPEILRAMSWSEIPNLLETIKKGRG